MGEMGKDMARAVLLALYVAIMSGSIVRATTVTASTHPTQILVKWAYGRRL